ncbi:DUF748 domain-containing protein [Trinickia terrae]|uniref:DUF748 domain-containing protein n=1 Tax=Trinickia terrae TaxID=2571161 RepID=A0A4U1IBD9_9BURK|nr:DUF748 domain-containing protein [Trinickia terrae]TKC90872.1 DUF748 domain-containing protein [Trinickia terrae]
MASRGKRAASMVFGVIAALIVAAIVGVYVAERELKARIANALAPLGSAERIDIGWSGVTLSNVRLHAPKGWPAGDTLRAERITIEPDLPDLLKKRVHMRSVVVDGFMLTVLRTASGGLQVVPNLREALNRTPIAADVAPAQQETRIDHIEFTHGTFEFYDETVRHPAYKIAVENARATVDDLRLPALSEPAKVSASGDIKGPQHTGKVSFSGWIKIASKDSQTNTQLRGVDIAVLDPYLLTKISAKTPVASGTLDMTVDATVRDEQLHAPGVVTLDHLQLAESGDPLDTFLSLPTKAAIAALKAHGDTITLHFVLDGDLRDPQFSLNERLATKLSSGFAGALGVSVKGVAKGVGETVKGLSGALRNLLGQ